MENTLFQQVESKLREAEHARLMRVPVGTISDRVGDLIHKAEEAGFIFKGPFAVNISITIYSFITIYTTSSHFYIPI